MFPSWKGSGPTKYFGAPVSSPCGQCFFLCILFLANSPPAEMFLSHVSTEHGIVIAFLMMLRGDLGAISKSFSPEGG